MTAMAIVAMPPSFHQFGEYSPAVWEKIPPHAEAFPYMRSHPVEDSVWDQIRSVFVTHGMTNEFALILLHRHFQLAPNERLVEYNEVAAPWEMDAPSVLPLISRIYPKSWALIGHKLCPYEFGFEADAATVIPSCQIPEVFIRDFEDVLFRHGLTRIFGLGLLQLEVNVTGVEKEAVEFTTGRTSITVPKTKEHQQGDLIEAGWKFADKDQALGKDSMTAIRTCNKCCGYHGA